LNPQALTVLFGLASAAFWGAGDFSGGLAAKRTNVYGVVIVSQAVGLLLLAALALLFKEPVPGPGIWLTGAIAGLIGAVGLTALYQGLATGRMGIVAPLTAIVAAIVPVVFGFVLEGAPSVAKMAGFALAIAAVWFLSRSGDRQPVAAGDLLLPVVAGICFGIFVILIDRVSEVAVLWPLVASRLASLAPLLLACALFRQPPLPAKDQLRLTFLAGILDSTGNAFYALAARFGRLDIAATLGSLHPASTVLLARAILKERLDRRQWFGVLLALVAVLLIAV
jgi:drug/metabolite transporter (DMT)-like permease